MENSPIYSIKTRRYYNASKYLIVPKTNDVGQIIGITVDQIGYYDLDNVCLKYDQNTVIGVHIVFYHKVHILPAEYIPLLWSDEIKNIFNTVPLYFRVATLQKNKKIISFFANIHQNCNMTKYKNDLVRIICNDGRYIDRFEDMIVGQFIIPITCTIIEFDDAHIFTCIIENDITNIHYSSLNRNVVNKASLISDMYQMTKDSYYS